jgi:hypothetical protein
MVSALRIRSLKEFQQLFQMVRGFWGFMLDYGYLNELKNIQNVYSINYNVLH